MLIFYGVCAVILSGVAYMIRWFDKYDREELEYEQAKRRKKKKKR